MIPPFKDKKVIQIFDNIKEYHNHKGLCKVYNLYLQMLMTYIRKYHFEYIFQFSNYVSEIFFIIIDYKIQLVITHNM